mmetsp:Transcript_57421/g.107994  ORF Transcript_57421/g.107994 Transcript_57421/m.107994 type:complete len:215 (+) Transcript_57421:87-731(+)
MHTPPGYYGAHNSKGNHVLDQAGMPSQALKKYFYNRFRKNNPVMVESPDLYYCLNRVDPSGQPVGDPPPSGYIETGYLSKGHEYSGPFPYPVADKSSPRYLLNSPTLQGSKGIQGKKNRTPRGDSGTYPAGGYPAGGYPAEASRDMQRRQQAPGRSMQESGGRSAREARGDMTRSSQRADARRTPKPSSAASMASSEASSWTRNERSMRSDRRA